VIARRFERLEKLAERAADFEGEIYPLAGDMSKDEDIKNTVEKTVEKYGRVDVVVNNAGVLDKFLSADNMEDEVWDFVMTVNVTGPMKLIREAMPYMKEQKSGNIINISSVGGLFGAKGGLAYVTSKHAIIGMTKHIAAIFGDQGIRCNAIAPGTVETEIGGTVKEPNMMVLDKVMKTAEVYPVVGEPDDIGNLILFLASDESKFINGATIVSDGGWTIH
ncbi:MAG TPA: SDR family oxidoreductase, partial [Tissierellaceae bacterium]|nr:SDR family oxidoreductase [Tissierellaceae bacterium]